MALSRRGERKDRKAGTSSAPPSQNGSSNGNGSTPDAVRLSLDPEATERMQHVLVQRGLLTWAEIDKVLAADPAGADLGDLLVSHGMLKEHDLTEARSEISGLPIVDLREANPEAEALALIPDSMAREHFVIPMSVDEAGLTIAVVDAPSPELMQPSQPDG